MKTSLYLVLGALGLAFSSAAAAKMPEAVQQARQETQQMCQEAGGKFSATNAYIQQADLNGDGITDYVMDDAQISCEGAESLFAGSGGSAVTVFAGTQNGAAKVFSQNVFAVKLERDRRPPRLYLGVGGKLCGQKNTEDMSNAQLSLCLRPLRWDAKRHVLDFAPLAEKKPLHL